MWWGKANRSRWHSGGGCLDSGWGRRVPFDYQVKDRYEIKKKQKQKKLLLLLLEPNFLTCSLQCRSCLTQTKSEHQMNKENVFISSIKQPPPPSLSSSSTLPLSPPQPSSPPLSFSHEGVGGGVPHDCEPYAEFRCAPWNSALHRVHVYSFSMSRHEEEDCHCHRLLGDHIKAPCDLTQALFIER